MEEPLNSCCIEFIHEFQPTSEIRTSIGVSQTTKPPSHSGHHTTVGAGISSSRCCVCSDRCWSGIGAGQSIFSLRAVIIDGLYDLKRRCAIEA
jgi:hypothetical protein